VSLKSQSILLVRWGCLLLHVPAVHPMTQASSCHACLECHRFYTMILLTSLHQLLLAVVHSQSLSSHKVPSSMNTSS
jgi:hypothetical protein